MEFADGLRYRFAIGPSHRINDCMIEALVTFEHRAVHPLERVRYLFRLAG